MGDAAESEQCQLCGIVKSRTRGTGSFYQLFHRVGG